MNDMQALQRFVYKIVEYESVLGLIAAPVRSDGTYNRSREACEQLAKEVLEKWNVTGISI